jgi:hypothetical protein
MASNNDMKAANATYDSFIGVIKVSTPIIIVIAATVIYLLAH